MLLREVIERHDLYGVKCLIEPDEDGNRLDPNTVVDQRSRITGLHLAARLGHQKIAEYLIQHGTDVNNMAWGDPTGHTPLYAAAEAGWIHIVQFLLEMGANPKRGPSAERCAHNLYLTHMNPWKRWKYLKIANLIRDHQYEIEQQCFASDVETGGMLSQAKSTAKDLSNKAWNGLINFSGI